MSHSHYYFSGITMKVCMLLALALGVTFCVGVLVDVPHAYAAEDDGVPNPDGDDGVPNPDGRGDVVPTDTITFANPLGSNTIEGLLGRVLTTIQGIVAVLAILFIVIGGVLYITSGGNSGRITTAKSAITAAIIGLALALAGPSFLKEIYTVIGAANPEIGSELQDAPTITEIVMGALQFLLSIVGILSIIMLVIGGIMYIISAGDGGRVKTAKDMILYSIIGLIVSLVSLVIVRQIVNFF